MLSVGISSTVSCRNTICINWLSHLVCIENLLCFWLLLDIIASVQIDLQTSVKFSIGIGEQAFIIFFLNSDSLVDFFDELGLNFNVSLTWIGDIIVIRIKQIGKSTLSFSGVGIVVITVLVVIDASVVTYDGWLGIWDGLLEVFVSIRLSFFLDLQPVDVDVEVNILFHLSQVHVVEISNNSDIWSKVQFIHNLSTI